MHSELALLVLVRCADERGALVTRPRGDTRGISLVTAPLDERTHWTVLALDALRAATGARLEPHELEPVGFRSSDVAPFTMTLLARARCELDASTFAPLAPHAAVERGVVFGSTGLKRACTAPSQYAALERFLNENGLRGKHRFEPR